MPCSIFWRHRSNESRVYNYWLQDSKKIFLNFHVGFGTKIEFGILLIIKLTQPLKSKGHFLKLWGEIPWLQKFPNHHASGWRIYPKTRDVLKIASYFSKHPQFLEINKFFSSWGKWFGKRSLFPPASGVIFDAWPYTSEFSLAFEAKILFWGAQTFSFLCILIFYEVNFFAWMPQS